MRLAALLLLVSAAGFAATWSGTLVDSKCFAASERNVNPDDTLTAVDRDQNQEIRYCAPRMNTTSFILVKTGGESYKLDSAGNAKAVELVRKAGKRPRILVTVTGELKGNTIGVDSISTGR